MTIKEKMYTIRKMMQLTETKCNLMKETYTLNNTNIHYWEKLIRFAEINIQRDEEDFNFINNILEL